MELKKLHELNPDVEKHLTDDLEKVKSELKETKKLLLDTATDAKKMLQEVLNQSYDKIKKTTQDAKEDFTNYTQNNPIKTIGWSVLTGVLISQLIKFTRKKIS